MLKMINQMNKPKFFKKILTLSMLVPVRMQKGRKQITKPRNI